MAPPLLLIAGKDLRQRLRDRTAWVTAFVAPLILAVIVSLAFGSFNDSLHSRIAVAADGDPAAARVLFRVLHGPELRRIIRPRWVGTAHGASAALRRDKADAALVVRADGTVRVLTRGDHAIDDLVARSVADGFQSRVQSTGLADATAAALHLPAVGAVSPPGSVVQDRAPGPPVKPVSYVAPAMAMLFLFFTAGFGARAFFVERRDGTLARLLAAPVRPADIVAGKTLATFVLGLGSLLTMYAVTTLLFGASWGPLLGVVVLCTVVVLSVMALIALVTSFARTDEQANGLGTFVAFAVGLLGGSFIPIALLPHPLQVASLATPNGWAMRGFADLVGGRPVWASIATPVTALLAFTVALGAVAAVRAPRLVRA